MSEDVHDRLSQMLNVCFWPIADIQLILIKLTTSLQPRIPYPFTVQTKPLQRNNRHRGIDAAAVQPVKRLCAADHVYLYVLVLFVETMYAIDARTVSASEKYLDAFVGAAGAGIIVMHQFQVRHFAARFFMGLAMCHRFG